MHTYQTGYLKKYIWYGHTLCVYAVFGVCVCVTTSLWRVSSLSVASSFWKKKIPTLHHAHNQFTSDPTDMLWPYAASG